MFFLPFIEKANFFTYSIFLYQYEQKSILIFKTVFKLKIHSGMKDNYPKIRKPGTPDEKVSIRKNITLEDVKITIDKSSNMFYKPFFCVEKVKHFI